MTSQTCGGGMCRKDPNCPDHHCEGRSLLAECAASGQMSASQINDHHMNGELKLHRVMEQQITGEDRRDRALTRYNDWADDRITPSATAVMAAISGLIAMLALFFFAGFLAWTVYAAWPVLAAFL